MCRYENAVANFYTTIKEKSKYEHAKEQKTKQEQENVIR
jgi:hypothetical protein